MGIGWLWIYTHSNNPEPLARANERRAFIFYSRWRTILLWTSSIYSAICAFHHKRQARRTLLALPDHLLRDIGMFRTGSDVRDEEVCRLTSRNRAAKTPDKNTCKNTNHDQPENVLIIDFDCTRIGAETAMRESSKNAHG